MSVRSFINVLEKYGLVRRVLNELSINYEIAKVVELLDKSKYTLIFKKLRSYDDYVGFANVVNTREKLYLALNVKSDEELYVKLLKAEEEIPKCKVELTNNVSFKALNDVDLTKLPIAKYYEYEPRSYLTSAVVIGLDLEENFLNMSIHRLSIIDKDKFVIRLVPRHLHNIYMKNRKLDKDTPIAIAWGLHPAILIAASSSPPYGYSELNMASILMNYSLKFYELSNGIYVPAEAEVVMEGYISKDLEFEEGPFVDILGMYDEVRRQPVVKVTKIYLNTEKPIHAHYLVPALSEHKVLMSIEKEAKIWKFVSNVVPKVKTVRLTSGSGSWLHAVIAIRKYTDGDAKNAILAAFTAHPSLKHVVVIDDDVDPDNLEEVEWAIATRFRGDEDLVIVKYVRGSTLDPSAIDQNTGLTVKIGIDATKPLSRDIKKFEKAKIPGRIDIEDLKIE